MVCNWHTKIIENMCGWKASSHITVGQRQQETQKTILGDTASTPIRLHCQRETLFHVYVTGIGYKMC